MEAENIPQFSLDNRLNIGTASYIEPRLFLTLNQLH